MGNNTVATSNYMYNVCNYSAIYHPSSLYVNYITTPLYDISGKMAPLARDMAADFDLWRMESQRSE